MGPRHDLEVDSEGLRGGLVVECEGEGDAMNPQVFVLATGKMVPIS